MTSPTYRVLAPGNREAWLAHLERLGLTMSEPLRNKEVRIIVASASTPGAFGKQPTENSRALTTAELAEKEQRQRQQ